MPTAVTVPFSPKQSGSICELVAPICLTTLEALQLPIVELPNVSIIVKLPGLGPTLTETVFAPGTMVLV